MGQRLELSLASTHDLWSTPRLVGSRVLRALSVSDRSGTITVTYLAIDRGRTTIEATESPRCAPGEACPAYVLLWRTTVIVR